METRRRLTKAKVTRLGQKLKVETSNKIVVEDELREVRQQEAHKKDLVDALKYLELLEQL